ncbi:hypothetical protein [Neobacillus drentensis]|uniref:hypothetical protein n=1 Tax=Neobacillus drentensis TaxID=220684 RepID=UPI00285C8194|nr:hypothetical protein [Neobacillus drentensis]MDR7238125.1 hypothetical protein [Neobacillus drentensis]
MKNNNRKRKIVYGSIYLVFIIVAGSLVYYFQYYEEDLNHSLPLMVTVESEGYKQEDIASQLLTQYLQQYQETTTSSRKRMTNVRYNNFQLLAGDEHQFAVGVSFEAKLETGKWSAHRSWGKVQKDGTVKGIQWMLRNKQTGENTYLLERIENTSQAIAGLDPLEDRYQKEAGIKVPDQNHRYEIVNEELKVTYDHGEHWRSVPVPLNDLFAGGYSGSKQELIEGSYVISPERTAFVIGDSENVRILLTTDKGEHWRKVPVPNSLPGIRIRLLGFTSKQDGYLILTGDKTMSWEANAIFKTKDGGKSWVKAGYADEQRLITGGGFITDQLGFIFFGSINVMDQPPRPSLEE